MERILLALGTRKADVVYSLKKEHEQQCAGGDRYGETAGMDPRRRV
jgi:hypothetical protein